MISKNSGMRHEFASFSRKRIPGDGVSWDFLESLIKPDSDTANAMFITNQDARESNEFYEPTRYASAVAREMYYQQEMKLLLAIVYRAIGMSGGELKMEKNNVEMFSSSSAEYHELLNRHIVIEDGGNDIVIKVKL